jgi:hypothetical protein
VSLRSLAMVAALVAVPSAAWGVNPTVEWSALIVYGDVQTPITSEGNIVLPPGMTYAGWTCVVKRETRLKTGQYSRSIICNAGSIAVATTAACMPAQGARDNGYMNLIVGDESIGLFVFCDVRSATVAGVSL